VIVKRTNQANEQSSGISRVLFPNSVFFASLRLCVNFIQRVSFHAKAQRRKGKSDDFDSR